MGVETTLVAACIFGATLILIAACKSYLERMRAIIVALGAMHEKMIIGIRESFTSGEVIIGNRDPQPIIVEGHGDMDPMGARVLVVMFFGGSMASPGTVIAHYLPIAANAMATEGWGVFTNSRTGDMAAARTKACAYAKKGGYTHILMLDNDHKHPANIVRQLLAHDKDVVGGLNFKRTEPHHPCAVTEILPIEGRPGYSRQTFPARNSGLVKVDGVGTGCLLVKLSALERLEKPWFYMPYHDFASGDMTEESWPGEDGGFCLRCKEAGVEMFCDTGLTSPHLAERWVG